MIPRFQTLMQNVHTSDREQNQSPVLAKKQIKLDFRTNFAKVQKRMGSLSKSFQQDSTATLGFILDRKLKTQKVAHVIPLILFLYTIDKHAAESPQALQKSFPEGAFDIRY